MTPRIPRSLLRTLAPVFLFSSLTTMAQQPSAMPEMPMSQMDRQQNMSSMPQMPGMMMQPTNLIQAQLNHLSSGTTVEPPSTPMYMMMGHRGAWIWMLHGEAFVTDIQQMAAQTPEGRRGGDKLFSANWIMPMAMRRLGPGQLTLRAMFSLEPATMTDRQYPLLFQQGETAFGKPIVDGQHPHNFFMEVAALYDIRLSERTLLSFYAAPIGDPAIGPTAYPHRMSASENPIAALGHHQEDSTHIAYNVLTSGLTWRWFRIEGSGFHGGEPSEGRWQFQPSSNGLAIDSYSTRLTVSPNGQLERPVLYRTHRKPRGALSSRRSAASDRLRHVQPSLRRPGRQRPHRRQLVEHAPLGTHPLDYYRTRRAQGQQLSRRIAPRFARRNYVWTRIENAGRTSELLLPPGSPLPAGFEEDPIGHVQAYSFGYDRDFRLGRHLTAAPGAQFTTYTTPEALRSTYGDHPWGVAAFVRFRIAR